MQLGDPLYCRTQPWDSGDVQRWGGRDEAASMYRVCIAVRAVMLAGVLAVTLSYPSSTPYIWGLLSGATLAWTLGMICCDKTETQLVWWDRRCLLVEAAVILALACSGICNAALALSAYGILMVHWLWSFCKACEWYLHHRHRIDLVM